MKGVHSHTLQRAAGILGGTDALCECLKVEPTLLESWLTGQSIPPTEVFLRAVDVIASGFASPAERSRVSPIAIERSTLVLETIRKRGLQGGASAGRVYTSLEYLKARFEPRQGGDMIGAALHAAISATAADMGNVQLREPQGLRIVAQRGFCQPFLDFFACVHDTQSACGAALIGGVRTIVPDVASDPLFAGTASRETMLVAEARAVQSTPLIGSNGQVMGMLSTHYKAIHDVTAREKDVLNHIARRTAFWLEGGRL
jgi:GAF domain-containing protein